MNQSLLCNLNLLMKLSSKSYRSGLQQQVVVVFKYADPQSNLSLNLKLFKLKAFCLFGFLESIQTFALFCPVWFESSRASNQK